MCRDITFRASTGEFLVVVGPNGAGKSSLLGALAGCVDSDGSAILDGQQLHGRSARNRARAGVALVPEGRRNLFPTMTVEENLLLGLRLLPAAERPQMRGRLLDMFGKLAERLKQVAGSLSGGEQQMLAIAVALARRPRALLLDEPSQGLAPKILEQLTQLIGGLRSLGLTLLLAEQNHRFAAGLADRYLALQGGEIVRQGDGCDLLDRQHAARALIG
ncbi:MAG: ATP-binding cassette domain-containing protein [Lautropia sp.]